MAAALGGKREREEGVRGNPTRKDAGKRTVGAAADFDLVTESLARHGGRNRRNVELRTCSRAR